MPTHIAILGWGSLLWDERPEFDEHRSPWELDGPDLKLEFSRVSESRSGALTLVVDPVNGSICRVANARSKRRNPKDAICDLRSREGTTRSNMGIYFADGSSNQSKDPATLDTIKAWATSKDIDVVLWTDLPSNFAKDRGCSFSVENAVAYLRNLEVRARSRAAEYVWRAPSFVSTPLRTALQAEPWFKQ